MCEDIFVWDTTGLLYAQAADRLQNLLEAAGLERRHIVPSGVMLELENLNQTPSHALLEIRDLTEIEDFPILTSWMERLGSRGPNGPNAGEAWVAALAQVHHGVAIIDDYRARKVIRKTARNVEVRGVLWAISRAVKEGRVQSPQACSGLCDQMLQAHRGKELLRELRRPFSVGQYARWYEEEDRNGNL